MAETLSIKNSIPFPLSIYCVSSEIMGIEDCQPIQSIQANDVENACIETEKENQEVRPIR